jgi:FkbM family methyltransferase
VAIEKIIHFSVPKNSTPLQTEAIERARRLHSDWEIKVWRDPVAPDGFLLEPYWKKAHSGAQFSDLLRLDVVYRWGGVYLDSDVLLLKPLDQLAGHYEFFIASEDGIKLTNAAFGASKGHPAIRALIDELLFNEPDWTLCPVATTGPTLFAAKLKWEKSISVLPRETFYPYQWHDVERAAARPHTYAEHLWVSSWKAEPRPPTVSHGRRALLGIKKIVRGAIATGFRIAHRIRAIDPAPKRTWEFYGASAELVVKTAYGFKIVLDGGDLHLTPEMVFEGCCEPAEENVLRKILKGGDWMIDVGANVGPFALLAAQQVGPFGRVFAYEPNPRPMTLLARSVAINRMQDRVVRRPVAVGASCDLAEVKGAAGAASAMEPAGGEDMALAPGVQLVRLDDEFPVDLPIKLLRINVKGSMACVLRGARRLVERHCIEFIMLRLSEEVAELRRNSMVEELNKLLLFGYSVRSLDEDGNMIPQHDIWTAVRLGKRSIVFASPPAAAKR